MDSGKHLTAAAFDYDAGERVEDHTHEVDQFLYAARGTMSVRTRAGNWVVPPHRALWVPAGMDHAIKMIGPVHMRTLYVAEGVLSSMPPQCCVVAVSPLLRELILAFIALEASQFKRRVPLVELIVDELRTVYVLPLHVPMPAEGTLSIVCEEVRRDPGSTLKLTDWSSRFGVSSKTLTREFVRATGMTFVRWRQQVRLLAALERLAKGDPVTAIALDLGYQSPSAFTAMFQKALGTTPSEYFNAGGTKPD